MAFIFLIIKIVLLKKNIYLYLFLSLLKLFDWINEFSVSHFFPNLSLRNCYPKCPNHSSFSGFFRFVAIKIDIFFIFFICIFCFCFVFNILNVTNFVRFAMTHIYFLSVFYFQFQMKHFYRQAKNNHTYWTMSISKRT